MQERKGGSRTSVRSVEVEAVETAVAKRARELTAEEERVVRVRHAVQAPGELVLERKATAEGLDELLLMELEIFRRYKAHLASLNAPKPVRSAAKDKIVRALRRKA